MPSGCPTSTCSSASITPLPMPRAGTLMMRRKRQVVVRVQDQLQIRQRVLDFLALVEPDATEHDVRDVGLPQTVFDRARLRVGPIQHRHRVLDVFGQRLARDARDVVGLFELVSAAKVDDLCAALPVGPQRLLLAVAVVGDDRRRGVENDLRRTVVPFEADDDGFGKVGFEIEDVAEVGAAPLVDRLIRIADDGQVAVAGWRAA